MGTHRARLLCGLGQLTANAAGPYVALSSGDGEKGVVCSLKTAPVLNTSGESRLPRELAGWCQLASTPMNTGSLRQVHEKRGVTEQEMQHDYHIHAMNMLNMAGWVERTSESGLK